MNAKKIHPKVIGSSLGAAVGVLIIAILNAAGAHPSPDLAAALSTALSAVAGYLTPANQAEPVSVPQAGSEEAQPIL